MTINLRNGTLLRRLISIKKNYRSCSNLTLNHTEYNPIEAKWNVDILNNLQISFKIIPDFINEEEELSLVKEVEPHLKRLVYEKDHWDEAIIGFRETEKKHWNKMNEKLIEKLRLNAFKPDVKHLPYVHVLDLAEEGHIKPHIDSSRVSFLCFKLINIAIACIMHMVLTKCLGLLKYLGKKKALSLHLNAFEMYHFVFRG